MRTAVLVIALLLSPVVGGAENTQPASAEQIESQMLRATIKAKLAEIDRLKAENAKLAAELAAVKKAATDAGVSIPKSVAKPAPPVADEIIYLGKIRTQEWLDQQYGYFKDKIVFKDGKYIDVGKEVACKKEVGATVPADGFEYGLVPVDSKVLSVINKDEAIVRRSGIATQRISGGTGIVAGRDELLFHVTHLSSQVVVDGSDVSGRLLYVGTHQYDTIAGTRTVVSYQLCKPLTKEEFLAAIDQGIRLTRYTATANYNRKTGKTEYQYKEIAVQ